MGVACDIELIVSLQFTSTEECSITMVQYGAVSLQFTSTVECSITMVQYGAVWCSIPTVHEHSGVEYHFDLKLISSGVQTIRHIYFFFFEIGL